jgi:hypothetical protein
MLESIQILDTVHHWAIPMHQQYQGQIGQIQHFETNMGISVLSPQHLAHPPCGSAIPLMWLQLRYSLQVSQ